MSTLHPLSNVASQSQWRINVSLLIALALGGVVAAAVMLPALLLAVHGISLTGYQEEAIGYRYFDSLRILYSPERPWLPQGQLVGLFDMAIQLVLTAAGHPIVELFPRIDLFTDIAILIPALVAGIAFVWALLPVRASIRTLVATSLVPVGYMATNGVAYAWLPDPDYILWAFPAAFFTFGWILRLRGAASSRPIRSLDPLLLGAIAGVLCAVKPTFAVFAVSIGVLMAIRDGRPLRMVLLVLCSIATCIITWSIFILAYYRGDSDAYAGFFVSLLHFARTQQQTLPTTTPNFPAWVESLAPKSPHDLSYLPALVVVLLLAGLLVRPWRLICVALLPASLLSVAVLYQRYYWATQIEAQAFAWMALWAAMMWRIRRDPPVLRSDTKVTARSLANICPSLAGLAFLAFMASPIVNWWHDFYAINAQYQRANSQFEEDVDRAIGETAFLSANNAYRLTNVDSAICKGGTDIFQPQLGLSQFMQQLFPNRWCGQVSMAVYLGQFDNLAFLRLAAEPLPDARQRLDKAYSSTMTQFDCNIQVPTVSAVLVLCQRTQPPQVPAAPQLHVTCTPGPTARLQWEEPTNRATQYAIRFGSAGAPLNSIGTVAAPKTSYAVGDIPPRALFSVQGCNIVGCGPASAGVEADCP